MKVLMYGWEYPPFHTGGLGIACKGIVEGLLHHGMEVTLVLPNIPSESEENMPSYCLNARSIGDIKTKNNEAIIISPYISEKEYQRLKSTFNYKKGKETFFSRNLIEKSYKYGERAEKVAKEVPHDIIHTHDWLTFPAGIVSKKVSDKPMVAHIHSTEFDRSGDNPNPEVYEIEKMGLDSADSVLAVSNYTKQKIIEKYGIPPDKIKILYNAIDPLLAAEYHPSPIKKTDKIVLFLGRITLQKGPDYFLDMAKKVLEKVKNVKFIMAGDGDMMNQMIRKSIQLGIEKNILFTGFLRSDDVVNTFQNADCYVMPSVSEPFGLTALEAVQNGAPVLVSKQSGVSEVILNALKVDFWDIDEMANKVISVLKHPPLSKTIRHNAFHEIKKFSWKEVGRNLINHYKNLNLLHAGK